MMAGRTISVVKHSHLPSALQASTRLLIQAPNRISRSFRSGPPIAGMSMISLGCHTAAG